MKRSLRFLAICVVFILAACVTGLVIGQDPPKAFKELVFAVQEPGSGYVHRAVDDVLTFAPKLQNGPTKRIRIIAPEGMRAFPVWDLEGNAEITFAPPIPDPVPTPTPSASPTHEPSPTPSPEPTATPTVPPTPSPSPSATPSPEPTATPSVPPTPSPSPSSTPSPEPTPVPTPTPTPTAEPTPGPCAWGTDWQGVCLPKPPELSCKSLPDDPVGLKREGFGCDSKGGSGTNLIRVTQLGPDGADGTLRWAYDQIQGGGQGVFHSIAVFFGANPGQRRIVIDPALKGDIVLDTPIYWKKSYATLDCSLADVKVKPVKAAMNTIVFGASTNLIVYGCRGAGPFKGSDPNWVPGNDAGIFTLDGDVPPIACEPWDDLCNDSTPMQRKAVRLSIFDRNTLSGCRDDCLASWGGVQDVSITRNIVHDSFHPSTTGWKGLPLPDPAMMRLRISWLYNVHYRNGERNVAYPREGAHWWVVARNLILDWQWFQYKDWDTGKPAWNSPQAVRVAGQYSQENNMGWGLANCALGQKLGNPVNLDFNQNQPNSHFGWGLTVDNGGCDNAPNCCAPACDLWDGADIKCCNPRVAKTKLMFVGNEGAAYEWSKPNPAGYVAPPLPFVPDVTRAWSRVINEAGSPFRTADEEAYLAGAATRAQTECKVPVPPQ